VNVCVKQLASKISFDFKSVYSQFSQKYTTFFSMFQDVSPVFSHVFSHVFTMFQPFWPLGLLRCLRVLLLRNAEINSSQVAELLAGTLHLEPTEEVRCVCCAKVDAVGCLRLDGCQMVGDDE